MLDFLSMSSVNTLDPSITFSRASLGWYYNSAGNITQSQANLLAYSNQFDNAAWTKSNSFVQTNLLTYSQDYSNASWSTNLISKTVNSIVATASTGPHSLIKNLTFTAARHTLSFIVSYVNWRYVILKTYDGTSDVYANFDIVSGLAGAVSGCTSTITNLGNNQYRVTLTQNSAAGTLAGNIALTFSDAAGFATPTGANPSIAMTGTETITVLGAQLVQGTVPGDYRATTSAALPVLYTGPTGLVDAEKLCESATTSTHNCSESPTTTAALFTCTWYAKAAERNFVAIYHSQSNASVSVNLTTGAIGVVAGAVAPVASSAVAVGSGWYRISMTVNATAASNFFGIYTMTDLTGSSYTGDGSSGIYISRSMLDYGSTVGAYLDNATASAYYAPRFDYDPTGTAVLGSELVTNGDFSGGTTTGWTALSGGLLSVVSGQMKVENSATFGRAWQAITVTANRWYEIRTTAVAGTANATIRFGNGGAGTSQYVNAISTTGVFVWRIYATTATIDATLYCESAIVGATVFFDNISVKEITGYIATPKGLLIEEARTNLLLQSNDFQTSWTPTNITRTLASTTGPDGTLSGVKIAVTASLATSLYQDAVIAATSATGSVYVKQGTGATVCNTFYLRNVTTAIDLVAGTLNYSTGVFTYTVGSAGVVVTDAGNGWWRIALSATSGITSGNSVRLYVGYAGGAQTAGDFLYAYGAQLEAGAFATSYIPTVASQVTRAADVASVNTLTPWFNASAGTLYSQFDVLATTVAAAMAVVSLDNGAANGYILYKGASSANLVGIIGANSSTLGAITANTPAKAVVAYDGVSNGGTLNGAAVTAITVAAVSTPNTLRIGSFWGGSQTSGHIQSIRYYPTRLPDAKLQALTA